MFNSKEKSKIFSLRNSGQTLIETLAAAFILTMGVTAATGLAIYAFNSSGGIVKQIIATGLAREGLEAVRNMRDTNWLQDALNVNGCYNYATSQSGAANCYNNWLNKYFCIDPANSSANACAGPASGSASLSFNLGFDPASSQFWLLTPQVYGAANYGLIFDPANSSGRGFYNPGIGIACLNSQSSISDYCRKIIITELTPSGSPYDPAVSGGASQSPGPLLEVQSQVWWVDKKCPRAADFSGASASCRVELDTYLTNWKTF